MFETNQKFKPSISCSSKEGGLTTLGYALLLHDSALIEALLIPKAEVFPHLFSFFQENDVM
jgi:hypothetical protein